MSEQSKRGAWILGTALVLGLSSLGYQLGHAALSVKAMERTVVVKGLSEREVPATVAAWPISFQVATNDLTDMYAAIERGNEVVRAFLVEHGVASEDISVSAPNVTDLYAQHWGDKNNIRFRYTGTATVTVYSTNVPAVRQAMANELELGKRGVITTGNYPGSASDQFLFTGLNAIKPAMIEEATLNARTVAEKFAQDSHSRLGKIKSARQGQFSIFDRDSTTPHIKKVRVVSTVEYYLSD